MNAPNTINDGGPAFASGNPTHGGHEGMSLRAYFAGQALQGWLASYSPEIQHPAADDCERWLAELSVKMADAMIAELNKPLKR